MNKHRKTRLEQGLCVSCGKNKHRANRTTCEDCGKKASVVAQNSMKKRTSNGCCARCGEKGLSTKSLCKSCQTKQQEHWCNKITKIREEVYAAYGDTCNHCKETDKDVLTLDHVNDDGAIHRQEVGSGWPIYVWAIRNNFPDSLQILCANCQMRKLRKQMARRRQPSI